MERRGRRIDERRGDIRRMRRQEKRRKERED